MGIPAWSPPRGVAGCTKTLKGDRRLPPLTDKGCVSATWIFIPRGGEDPTGLHWGAEMPGREGAGCLEREWGRRGRSCATRLGVPAPCLDPAPEPHQYQSHSHPAPELRARACIPRTCGANMVRDRNGSGWENTSWRGRPLTPSLLPYSGAGFLFERKLPR